MPRRLTGAWNSSVAGCVLVHQARSTIKEESMRFFILAAMMAAVLAVPAAGFAGVPDPNDPNPEPAFYHLKCASRITATGGLQVLQRCPGGASAPHFADGFNKMRTGAPDAGFPRCDLVNDVIRLTFPIAAGVPTNVTSPELGECQRGGVVVFSRPLPD